MITDETHGLIRLVPRDLYHIHQTNKQQDEDTPIAIVIGYPPSLALAASTPNPYGKSELDIANTLMFDNLELIETPKNNIYIPSDVEFVIEGRILANVEGNEGPFVDITGTIDAIRSQPVVEIEKIYHKAEPIFQTILPAYSEHFILMGFPREVQIFNGVSKVVPKVHDVHLTTGGSGWLHAIISITPQKLGDAKNAALAAFAVHPSLKWCTVVDNDIDIRNSTAIEWATITRAGEGDIIITNKVRGSSLDPSRDPRDGTTIKVIIDATKKEEKGNEGYERIIPF